MKRIKKSSINKAERFIKKNFKNKTFVTILVVALSFGTYFYNEVYLENRETAVVYEVGSKDLRCVDGDTFKMNSETVRLLAIDTPETVKPNTPVQAFGKEASDATCKLLESANNIELKQDKNNEVDKYGRVLAWVFIDDIFLQEYLVENGLASIKYVSKSTVDKSLLNKLVAAEERAKSKKLGIWSLE